MSGFMSGLMSGPNGPNHPPLLLRIVQRESVCRSVLHASSFSARGESEEGDFVRSVCQSP